MRMKTRLLLSEYNNDNNEWYSVMDNNEVMV